jgi:hypothetical protein
MIASVSPSSFSTYSLNQPKQAGAGDGATQASGDAAGSVNSSDPVKAPADQSKPKDPVSSVQEQRQIEKLKQVDRAVRAHEQAHLAAAGGLAVSAATYSYRLGPDGKDYAVAGEVSIDTSPGKTPAETISKARRIEAAALAPADPSSQDQAVASRAEQMAMKAQQELALESMQRMQAAAHGDAGKPSRLGQNIDVVA